MANDLEHVQSGNVQVMNPYSGGAVSPSAEANVMQAAAEQRAMAEVQANMLMAQRFPRDERTCVDRIITSFSRRSLAEAATYQYARGGQDITGPSIRAAEAIAQQWGNFDFGFRELSRMRGADRVSVSQVQAYAIDVQNRTRRSIEFHVRHWRDTRQGGYALSDERDIYELVANQAQRRVRSCILALIPGDVVETAIEQAATTLTHSADVTPEGIKAMLERFATFGVTKEHIEGRIQRRIESITPAQVVSLRSVYNSLKDAMSKPSDWFEIDEPAPETPPGVTDMNARLAAKKSAATPAAKSVKAETKAPAKPTKAPAKAPASPTASEPSPGTDKGSSEAPDDSAAPVITFAQVADAMNKAARIDELKDIAESIDEVSDSGQRDELDALFRENEKRIMQ